MDDPGARRAAGPRGRAEELWELRENSRKSWGLLNGGRRRTYVDLADARLAVCQVAGLPNPSTSIARMPEAEFRAIVIGWMDHRRAGLEASGAS